MLPGMLPGMRPCAPLCVTVRPCASLCVPVRRNTCAPPDRFEALKAYKRERAARRDETPACGNSEVSEVNR